MKWKDNGLANIAGQAIRLRLYARNARLYSYWFEREEEGAGK
jgi:hypothetical protein